MDPRALLLVPKALTTAQSAVSSQSINLRTLKIPFVESHASSAINLIKSSAHSTEGVVNIPNDGLTKSSTRGLQTKGE